MTDEHGYIVDGYGRRTGERAWVGYLPFPRQSHGEAQMRTNERRAPSCAVCKLPVTDGQPYKTIRRDEGSAINAIIVHAACCGGEAQMSGNDGLTDEERLRVEFLTRPDTMTLEQWQASFPSVSRMVWQPIATAPKPTDDTVIHVLLAFHYPNGKYWGCMVMAWNRHNQDWDDGMGNSTSDRDAESEMPTHWMPLPEPPKEQPR